MSWAGLTLDILLTPVLAAMLLALALIDRRERRLPDRLTLPLIALGLALAARRAGVVPMPELVGAGAGFAAFWVIGEVHYRLRGIEGLGLGDAKLLAAAGAWLGWRDLPLLMLLATLSALAIVALTHLVRRSSTSHEPPTREIAFGPWLCAAFMALWLVRLVRGSI